MDKNQYLEALENSNQEKQTFKDWIRNKLYKNITEVLENPKTVITNNFMWSYCDFMLMDEYRNDTNCTDDNHSLCIELDEYNDILSGVLQQIKKEYDFLKFTLEIQFNEFYTLSWKLKEEDNINKTKKKKHHLTHIWEITSIPKRSKGNR